MKKEIKNYLHLYLGCNVIAYYKSLDADKKEIITVELKKRLVKINEDGTAWLTGNVTVGEFKPILRPLTSVTEDEWMDIEDSIDYLFEARCMDGLRDNFLSDKSDERNGWTVINNSLIELRKMGVDMDGLIESGLAIDATKIKK